MALIVPPFGFSKFATNYASTPTTTLGSSITTGASSADGATVSCLSALAFDAQLLELNISSNNTTATDSSTLIHVVIDPAGGTAWDTTNKLIQNVLAGYAAAPTVANSTARTFYFPVRIPEGASVGCNGRNVTGSTRTVRIGMRAFGGMTRPELWPTCDRVISLGDTAASSKGTTITPGNTGAAGSWTSVGSATTKDLFGVLLAVQGIGGTMAAVTYHVEVGISSTAIAPPLYVSSGTTEQMVHAASFPIYRPIASGSQMQVRATCSGTADNIDVCLYGLG